MKIFLDANILVTVLCNEYPQFTYCSRVLSLCDNPKFEVYTSPISLAIGFHFAEKKNGRELARKKIMLLSEKIRISTVAENTVKKAAADKSVNDLEVGMQYYAALNATCKCIITEDKGDFYFSKLETYTAEEFLIKYIKIIKG